MDTNNFSQEELVKIRESLQRLSKTGILSEDQTNKLNTLLRDADEIHSMVQDKRALGRALYIMKTALITAAGVLVAWQVFLNQGLKGFLHWLGVSTN